MNKRILTASLLRIILTFSLIKVLSIFDNFAELIYFLYIIGSILVFSFIFIRKSSTLNVSSKTKKTKIIFTKISLSVADISLYLLLGNITNYYAAIIYCQLLLHPAKSWIYYQYFFKTGNSIERIFLYPLPIIKEIKWLIIRFFGRVLQKYWPSSQITQKTLVSTTHFFRDVNEYENKILKYVSNKNVSSINVLVIGCATGQEPYSIAIVCQEHGIECKIDAIDFSKRAINKALIGKYSYEAEISLMQRSGKYDSIKQLDFYKEYFEFFEETISVSDNIKSCVNFKVQDITEIDSEGKYDFVFARKMLYYLPKTILPSVEKKLTQALKNNISIDNLIIDGYSQRVLKEYFG